MRLVRLTNALRSSFSPTTLNPPRPINRGRNGCVVPHKNGPSFHQLVTVSLGERPDIGSFQGGWRVAGVTETGRIPDLPKAASRLPRLAEHVYGK